jgi:hypothetical protein
VDPRHRCSRSHLLCHRQQGLCLYRSYRDAYAYTDAYTYSYANTNTCTDTYTYTNTNTDGSGCAK